MDALRDELFRFAEPDAAANALQLLGHLPSEHLEISGAEHPRGRALIGQKYMAGTRSTGDVDVLAHLDEAVGAQNRHPAVTPGPQAVRGEPVHSEIAGTAVAAD